MIKSDWSGFEKLQRKVKKLEKTQNIPFDKLFNSSFMGSYTQYSNIYEFFKEGGFKIETQKDFEKLPEEKLDKQVRKSTRFSSWNEMLTKAGENWLAKELGF
jgi:hypothetical protein